MEVWVLDRIGFENKGKVRNKMEFECRFLPLFRLEENEYRSKREMENQNLGLVQIGFENLEEERGR